MRVLLRVLAPAVASLLALCACAGAPQPRQARLDAAFARIQVAEARIAHARADVTRTENGCELVAAAPNEARAAQAELCAIAREAADADALIRCEHAARETASISAQAERRCRARPGQATHARGARVAEAAPGSAPRERDGREPVPAKR